MQRAALAIISLLLLAAWVALLIYGPKESWSEALASACMRSGLVLGALWLALPQVTQIFSRFSFQQMLPYLLGVLIVVARPRAFPVVLPVLAAVAVVQLVGWLFRPPPGSKKPHRPVSSTGKKRRGK